MFAWAGNQKAWMAAFGTFASTLLLQMTTGEAVSVDAEIGVIADLAADTARSAALSAASYVITWLKRNV